MLVACSYQKLLQVFRVQGQHEHSLFAYSMSTQCIFLGVVVFFDEYWIYELYIHHLSRKHVYVTALSFYIIHYLYSNNG